MYRHCLAVMVEALDAEPRAGFALSGSRDWPGGKCPMLLTPRLAYEREFLGSGLFHLGPASAMFRADVFRELGGFPMAGVASDYLFWLEACAKVNVLLVPGDLFYYRVHAGQEISSPTSALRVRAVGRRGLDNAEFVSMPAHRRNKGAGEAEFCLRPGARSVPPFQSAGTSPRRPPSSDTRV